MIFWFCCTRILLASAYYIRKTSTHGQSKFLNNQYIQYPLKPDRWNLPRVSQHFDLYTKRVFTMFWFCTNCTNFAWLTLPVPGNHKFFPFFHQKFSLNLLRCRCRNTKPFFGLDNCLTKLVQIAMTTRLSVRWRNYATGKYGSGVTLQLRDKGYTWCY